MFWVNRHALVICDRLRVDQWWTFGWLICHYLRLFYILSSLPPIYHLVRLCAAHNADEQQHRCFKFYHWNGTTVIIVPSIGMHSVNLCFWSGISSDWFWRMESASNWRDFRKMIHLDFTICWKTPSSHTVTRSERERIFICTRFELFGVWEW